MRRYVLQRLLQLIPILLGITLLSFALMYLAGGDVVTAMLENQGMAVTQELIDASVMSSGSTVPSSCSTFRGWATCSLVTWA